MHSRTKEEVPLLKLKHAESELKFHKEKIAVIVREFAEELSPEILEECGPVEKAPFLKQNEILKGEKLMLQITVFNNEELVTCLNFIPV